MNYSHLALEISVFQQFKTNLKGKSAESLSVLMLYVLRQTIRQNRMNTEIPSYPRNAAAKSKSQYTAQSHSNISSAVLKLLQDTLTVEEKLYQSDSRNT